MTSECIGVFDIKTIKGLAFVPVKDRRSLLRARITSDQTHNI